jgi:hypothetical protein
MAEIKHWVNEVRDGKIIFKIKKTFEPPDFSNKCQFSGAGLDGGLCGKLRPI